MMVFRVIPCLLLHKGGLVKTIKFKRPKYVGDPINAVRIFNEKEVDELLLIDIDATVEKREPEYDKIESIVSEAFMPVCYGGGVRSIKQMKRLFYNGVEKISISNAAINNPELISEASSVFGSQSVVVTLDVKKTFMTNKYQVVTLNAKKRLGYDPIKAARKIASLGAGELVINNVDHDGLMNGYDFDLMEKICSSINIPVVALGGAGKLDDSSNVIKQCGVSAAAAGSIFVFQGVHRAVLINYPSQKEISKLFEDI